nr:RNase H-like domain-containing protein [Nostoc sp. DedSLP05]
KFVLVFFDDILIYSKSWDEHILHLDLILKVLNDNRLYAKRSKCDFGRTEVEYLGHIISMNGVKVDPRKIEDMKNWPKPKTLKKLRGFLGLTGYYRKFVCNYGRIAAPLTTLLKKNSFHWTPVADKAFEHLKQAMCTTPVLAMPDFTKSFIIETDACDTGIGAVLMQEGRPLAFLSKALSGRNLGRSTYEKEMIAIIHVVNQWRPYLIGRHFIIKTDHLSLKYLMEQRVAHPEQQKWVSKLLGYDYEITYKKGKENVVADALSRKFEDSAELQAISFPIPDWLSKVQDEWQHDSLIQELIHLLQENPAAKPGYTWDGQYLRYKGRIALLPNSGLKKQILTELHASPMAGHSGYLKTYERLVQNFYWKGMKKDVQKFVAECDTCQRQKGETVASPGLLQPLPIPTQTWHHISMDFIEGLPKS